MKKLFLIPILALAVIAGGCTTPPKTSQGYMKSTTLGIVIDWPATSSYPSMKFGLVRDMWFSNPTSTNKVYAAPFHSDTHADLYLFHNVANEKFDAGAK